jgi:hypothetical protein
MIKDSVAVVGSRTFNDYPLVVRILDPMKDQISMLISGGADGADKLGERYADAHGIPKQIYYPDWDGYGKSAAFLRNQTIADECQRMVAFWDGKSRGTQDVIGRAVQAGKVVLLVPVGFFLKEWEKEEK